MNWTFEFSPLIDWPFFWGAFVIAVVIALLVLWGGARGSVLRTASLGVLLLALANPVLRQEQRRPLSNVVLAVVDKSASQELSGRLPLTGQLRAALSAKLAKIPNLQVRWLTSSQQNKGAERDGTTLFSDLNQGLSKIPEDRLSGVIMLTDGRVHDVPASASSLRLNVPIHAFITGQKGEQDRHIEVVNAPRYGLVGTEGEIKLRVRQSDKSQVLLPARVTIKREGLSPETVTVEVGEIFSVPMSFPHAGTNIVEAELVPLQGELTRANNRAVVVAEGVRENLRVLLVSGEPHPGERTWRNLLKSDAAVDLVHFTILRPPRKQDRTPIHQLSLIAFPTRELFSEKLQDFDLIIFDRYTRRGVLPLIYFDNITQFVRNGGAVLVSAGEAFASRRSLYQTPLAAILPAEPTGRTLVQPYRAKTTKSGRLHPVTRSLPGGEGENPSWGRWFRQVDAQAKRDAQLIMSGAEEKPLLLLDRVGKGRVALMLSDQAWLWARGFEGGGPFNPLFRRLAHWLMREPDLEEEALLARANGKKLIIERRTMTGKVGAISVTKPSGQKTLVTLKKVSQGLWRRSVEAGTAGIYRVKDGAKEAAVHVGKLSPREMSAVTATAKPMEPVVKALGGGVFWAPVKKKKPSAAPIDISVADLPRIAMISSGQKMHGSGWMGLADRRAYVVQGVKLTPLFAGFLALALALGLFSLMWYREGH